MIIFDFDRTLVDSRCADDYRRQGDWRRVMQLVRNGRIQPYLGVDALLNELHAAGQRLAIVTHSPAMVPQAMIERYGWPVDRERGVVGYHGLPKPHRRHLKPDPAGLRLAMRRAGVISPAGEVVIHVGDEPDDTTAARAAGVLAVGAAWGLGEAEVSLLRESRPHHLCGSVAEARGVLRRLVDG